MDDIHGFCDPMGIVILEDAACAIGATYRGSLIGADSDLVAFSFHPRKVITTGEGGDAYHQQSGVGRSPPPTP